MHMIHRFLHSQKLIDKLKMIDFYFHGVKNWLTVHVVLIALQSYIIKGQKL